MTSPVSRQRNSNIGFFVRLAIVRSPLLFSEFFEYSLLKLYLLLLQQLPLLFCQGDFHDDFLWLGCDIIITPLLSFCMIGLQGGELPIARPYPQYSTAHF
jgi:hypothetical protein